MNLETIWLPALLVAVLSYFLGCFNGAVIVSKYILKNDVRNHGSGNAGLTNFCRVFGGGLTFLVILTDVIKAVVSVLIGVWVAQKIGLDTQVGLVCAKYWAGLFCLIGHMFPCMFHFRGGKGILSGGTVALMIDWRVAVVVWGAFIIFMLLTRYVSLGSVMAGVTFPLSTWYVYENMAILLLSTLIGVLIVYMHRGNIRRMLHGEESRFTFSGKKK